MIQKIPIVVAIALSIGLLSTSCKKDCLAGSGGGLTFVVKLKHHGAIIPNDSLRPDTVWVKYNALTWQNPPSDYDARFIGEFPEDHVHVTQMKCGDYFIYAAGFDASINEQVRGGVKFSTDGKTLESQVDIAVIE